MRLARFVAALPVVLTLACSSTQQLVPDPPSMPHVDDPPADDGPAKEPAGLPGIDTSRLTAREKESWWRLVGTLYSPCPDQAVSVSQCVTEARPCAGCAPMAQFIADHLQRGATSVDAEAAAALRFGPDVKTVDIAGAPAIGPANATMTIVAWIDLQCPACKHVEPLLVEFQKKHPNDVRLVQKLYVLPKHAQYGEPAAKAAVAALRQGKYWPMEQFLFDNQEAIEHAELTVDEAAKKVGLDMTRYAADAASKETADAIARDMKQADEAGLRATPFIMIDGRHFDQDYFRFDELEEWLRIEQQLKAAKK